MSVSETLARSISTSLTVILVLSAMFLLGGESIRWFVLALLIGILSGTYSSIFNASIILAMWEERRAKPRPAKPATHESKKPAKQLQPISAT